MAYLRSVRSLQVSNAAFGVAEYISQPLLMLCATPLLLHRLGTQQYAIWVLTSATVTGGALLSTGFRDVAIKHISAARGRENHTAVQQLIRTLLAINLLFGTLVAAALFTAAPFLATHLPQLSPSHIRDYKTSIAIGALLLIVRSAESVFLCAQRAYELYRTSSSITIATRVAVIATAVVVAHLGHSVSAIMSCTLGISILGLFAQVIATTRHLNLTNIFPSIEWTVAAGLFSFGFFSWTQGLIAFFTGQADRLLIGYLLGTQSLAYYSLCTQIAMPIHGIASAGLQVLFPYFGARLSTTNTLIPHSKFRLALLANTVIVLPLAATVAFGSRSILTHWLNADFANHASITLTVTAISFALLGFNVTGHFLLLALGRIRTLTIVNLGAAVVMLAAMALLTPRYGILGAAVARCLYGPITWLSYFALRPTIEARSLHLAAPAEAL